MEIFYSNNRTKDVDLCQNPRPLMFLRNKTSPKKGLPFDTKVVETCEIITASRITPGQGKAIEKFTGPRSAPRHPPGRQ